MTEDEIDDLEKSIQPIHFLLTKVSNLYMNCTVFAKQSTQICKLAFTIKNSSTIALPQWYWILDPLSLNAQVMPHDVCTCWNATYDMLDFAYRYKQAINKITDICEIKLHEYEIKTHKWEVVQKLQDLLKVCCLICLYHSPSPSIMPC